MVKKKKNNAMVDRIKERVHKSAQGFGNFVRIPADKKAKLRFISDLDDAIPVTEHDKWGELTPTPCLEEHFNKECKWCEDSSIRKREVYCWTVWDYANKEKKILKFAGNNYTPVPQLISFFETYGNIVDRDYVISKTGTGRDISYGVVPLDKAEFKKKLRPFTEKEILENCIESSDEIDLDDLEELDGYDGDDEDEETDDDEEEIEEDEEEEELDEDDDDPFDE